MFFQLQKQVEVTGYQVRILGGWVGDNVPSKQLQKSESLAGSMGSSVVVEIAYALAQHSSSLVLNRPPEFCQCVTIPVSIYCSPSSHKIDQQYSLSISKHSCHDFTGRLCLLEFLQLRLTGMLPLTWLLFCLRCEVVCPGFGARDNRIQKVILFVCIMAEKFTGRFHSLPFVVFCQHSWDPSCTHLPILQLVCLDPINDGSRNLRKLNTEVMQREPPIFMHGLRNLRDSLFVNWWSPGLFFSDQMETPDTTFGYFWYPCTSRHTLQSIDDQFQSVYCLLHSKTE